MWFVGRTFRGRVSWSSSILFFPGFSEGAGLIRQMFEQEFVGVALCSLLVNLFVGLNVVLFKQNKTMSGGV